MFGIRLYTVVCAIFGTCCLLQDIQAKPGYAKRGSPTLRATHHDALKNILTSRTLGHGKLEARKKKDKSNKTINKGSAQSNNFDSAGCSADPLEVTRSTVLTSPGYPDDFYPHVAVCKWNIMASGHQRIKLHFNSFDMEYHMSCNFDVLRMYAGDDVYEFCGKDGDGTYPLEDYIFPEDVTEIRLVFVSDSTNARPGFNLSVTLAENDPCEGGSEMTEEGAIISPGYPHEYPNDASCQWHIRAPVNKVIKLVVEDFFLETQAFCSFDAVVITGGDQTITACGMYPDTTILPDALAFQTNDVQIVFHSDSSFTRPGFSLDVVFQDYCSDIPFLVSESGAVITSPDFGTKEHYPLNLNCAWDVKAPLGMTIDVNFNYFNVEENSDCAYDYLELRGINPQPHKFCGTGSSSNAPPGRQGFDTNEINIRFISDYSNAFSGFNIEVVFNESWDYNLG